jgi:hypothetical protein
VLLFHTYIIYILCECNFYLKTESFYMLKKRLILYTLFCINFGSRFLVYSDDNVDINFAWVKEGEDINDNDLSSSFEKELPPKELAPKFDIKSNDSWFSQQEENTYSSQKKSPLNQEWAPIDFDNEKESIENDMIEKLDARKRNLLAEEKNDVKKEKIKNIDNAIHDLKLKRGDISARIKAAPGAALGAVRSGIKYVGRKIQSGAKKGARVVASVPEKAWGKAKKGGNYVAEKVTGGAKSVWGGAKKGVRAAYQYPGKKLKESQERRDKDKKDRDKDKKDVEELNKKYIEELKGTYKDLEGGSVEYSNEKLLNWQNKSKADAYFVLRAEYIKSIYQVLLDQEKYHIGFVKGNYNEGDIPNVFYKNFVTWNKEKEEYVSKINKENIERLTQSYEEQKVNKKKVIENSLNKLKKQYLEYKKLIKDNFAAVEKDVVAEAILNEGNIFKRMLEKASKKLSGAQSSVSGAARNLRDRAKNLFGKKKASVSQNQGPVEVEMQEMKSVKSKKDLKYDYEDDLSHLSLLSKTPDYEGLINEMKYQ